ncbi:MULTISPECIES: rhodanese family protein [unclassified Novosphingobium]|uniref:rhodanese family protein n=1 Tax=unclassified Novosphingobium TaxID=2644732 RepID=UPI00146B41E2|nr:MULTISPECIES: rhodanese family protein [unclassified Novosphingobium]NMN05874.1 rhodanese-related sulfurtransferase [Novosphingobium sp. SG919]NMN87766.1 rhodanese-related sulfurtransferase [Novosphingobium sp. SG916]
MTLATLSPADTRAAIDAGAWLIDIRGADEHARERIPGAINVPLDRIDDLPGDGRPVVFHCKSGMRTAANAAQLGAAAGSAPAYILGGGIVGWRQAGQPVVADRSQPLEIMRQVQITAGALVLAGVLLGMFVAPGFFGLSAFVGAGLMVAGVTGWCGMANLLRVMPWNRRAAA